MTQFRLSKRQTDGKTLREHLESVRRQTGKTPPELEGSDEAPEMTDDWWLWWCELSGGRQQGFGASPLTWSDIVSWMRLTARRLTALDIAAIRAIDAAFLTACAEKG